VNVDTLIYASVRWNRRRREAALHVDHAASDPLLRRIEELRNQLAAAIRILPALQAELEQLAALHQTEAAAVQRLVEETIAAGNARIAHKSWRQQWGFWIAALVLSVPAGVAGNHLCAWLGR
jgi:hypothetical protein